MHEPIACTLTGADYAARMDQLAAIARDALRSREPIDGGARLVFDASDGTERTLRDVFAAEARCCSFLRFDLRRTGDTLEVEVTGPEAAKPIIAELFA
jgi:hypothetical protein